MHTVVLLMVFLHTLPLQGQDACESGGWRERAKCLAKKKAAEVAFDHTIAPLLDNQLPIRLNAREVFPTVDVLPGGPFAPKPLTMTADTMAKPLPPGDYAINVWAFCVQHGFHQPGRGIAYRLAPLRGKAAGAEANLLWRGIFSGVTPKQLQTVAWAIESGLSYDQMPHSFQLLVDKLIPDYKAELSGDVVGQLLKMYAVASAASPTLPPLKHFLEKHGVAGKVVLDALELREFALQASSDEERERALFGSQGIPLFPVASEQGPWTVRIPGFAYLRYKIQGGNLANDNVIEIRVLPTPKGTVAANSAVSTEPHLLLTALSAKAPVQPAESASIFSLLMARMTPAGIDVSGVIGYPIGYESQNLIPVPVPPPPITLVDPVMIATADAPAKILSSIQQLTSSEARRIVGVSADGVARAVIRIPTTRPGQIVTVAVCGDTQDEAKCDNQNANEYGSVTDNLQEALSGSQEDQSIWKSHVTAESGTMGGESSQEAFVVYRAPLDFTRKVSGSTGGSNFVCPPGYDENDCLAGSRSVFLKVTFDGTVSPWFEVKIVRPPLVLVHGFNSDSSAWHDVTTNLDRDMHGGLSFYLANYGQPIAGTSLHIVSSSPVITYGSKPALLDKIVRQSHFGFTFVAPCVFDQMQEVLGFQFVDAFSGRGLFQRKCLSESLLWASEGFRNGNNPVDQPIAASQVDVIAHSMGGLVTREILTTTFRSQPSFGKAIVHKLITLGTPHRGSPQAVLQLLRASACSRNIAANFVFSKTVSVRTFTTSNGLVPGAVGELSGNGRDLESASPALIILDRDSPVGAVPTALLAGDIGTSVKGLKSSRPSFFIRALCAGLGDPFAERLLPNRYATVFDPNIYPKHNGSTVPTPSDGSVPVTSATPSRPSSTFADYFHSVGIVDLISPSSHQLQDGSDTIDRPLLRLLNESAKSSSFVQ